jgi:ribosome-associated toxin RatA of RatAB toxin-antitoxin module
VAGIEGRAEAHIAADPADCLAVLEDFERYPEWQELIDEVEVIERDSKGRATVVEAVTKLAVKTFRYRLAYERASGRMRARRISGDFKHIELEWRIDSAPIGGSVVSYEFRGEASWALDRLLAPVRDAARREMIDDVVANLKARVEV